MKRLAVAILGLLLVASFIGAQEEPWIDQNSGLNNLVPGTMLSAVTNGQFYDEWDIIFRSPAELSNYEGYGLFTAYGNYENWANAAGFTGPAVGPVNPFTTNALATGTEIGNYLFGFTGPVLGVRAGTVAGYRLLKTNNVQKTPIIADPIQGDVTPNMATWEYSDAEDVDADANGTTEYSFTRNVAVTDYTRTTQGRAIAGVDLGFMGASLLASSTLESQQFGGTFDYSWEVGDDGTAQADQITSFSADYGLGENGEVAAYPDATNTWTFGILGDLPLELFGEGSPVAASLFFGYDTLAPAYVAPATYQVTTTNPTTGAAADDTSTLTYTVGDTDPTTGGADQVFDDAWYTNNNPADNGTDALNDGTPGALNTNYAYDAENATNRSFNVNVNALIDPRFALNDTVSVGTRALVGYDIDFQSATDAGFYNVNFDYANGGTANSTYTEESTIIAPQDTTVQTITGELGGSFAFVSGDERVSANAGFFYSPVFEFGSITYGNEVTNTVTSWEDTTNTDPEAAGDVVIGPGNNQGTRTVESTTVYDGEGSDNQYTHEFSIPVSVKYDVVPEKLSLIGGYRIDHTIVVDRESIPASQTTTINTVQNTSGTQVFTDATPDSAATVTTSESGSQYTTTDWGGDMNFMLRWMVNESMTVDIFGQSIMTALNFDLFGDDGAGTDFNPANVIGNLGMSVQFRF